MKTRRLRPLRGQARVGVGIAEAMNDRGELFGFDRIHNLLQKPVTAAEVASAAQAFGQEDDISVLRIVRSQAA